MLTVTKDTNHQVPAHTLDVSVGHLPAVHYPLPPTEKHRGHKDRGHMAARGRGWPGQFTPQSNLGS